MKFRTGFVSNSSSSSFIVAHKPEAPWSRERKEKFLEERGFRRCEDGMFKGMEYSGKEDLLLTNEAIENIMNTDCVLKVMDAEWVDEEELNELRPIAVSGVFMEY